MSNSDSHVEEVRHCHTCGAPWEAGKTVFRRDGKRRSIHQWVDKGAIWDAEAGRYINPPRRLQKDNGHTGRPLQEESSTD